MGTQRRELKEIILIKYPVYLHPVFTRRRQFKFYVSIIYLSNALLASIPSLLLWYPMQRMPRLSTDNKQHLEVITALFNEYNQCLNKWLMSKNIEIKHDTKFTG